MNLEKLIMCGRGQIRLHFGIKLGPASAGVDTGFLEGEGSNMNY